MAARTDFDYLRQLAVSAADRDVLDRIARDREHILSGGFLRSPGERLSLRLDFGFREPLALVLRSDLAPASLDTLLELYRDKSHSRVAGFCGEPGGTVVDLGAHEGYYAMQLKLLNPALQVVAVEPLTEQVELMEANLEANGITGVETYRTAIGTRNGTLTLECYPHVGSISSVDMKAFPRPWIRPELIRRRTVPSQTLSRLLERAGMETAELLKIDVEGSEYEILSQAAPLLRRFARIVVECHGYEARARCRESVEKRGFACVYAERKRSGDLYFVRR